MTIIVYGKNERIEYCNVDDFMEDETYYCLHNHCDKLVEVCVNGHMVACSDEIIIEKRCFICNEIYIKGGDTD